MADSPRFAAFLAGQILLVAANILTEAFRWHLLVVPIHRQPLLYSLRQTLSGIVAGAFSPGRLAEPFGKLYGIPKEKTVHAVSLSLFGSVVLNSVITSAGMFALGIGCMSGAFYGLALTKQHGWQWAVILWGVALLSAVATFRPLVRWMVRRFKLHRVVVGLSGKRLLLHVGIATVRYLVFSVQMWWALVFFGHAYNWGLLAALVPLYYLFVTLLPSFFGLDLGVRGSMALLVFGLAMANDGALLMSTFFIWALNLAFPSIAGTGLIIHSWATLRSNQHN